MNARYKAPLAALTVAAVVAALVACLYWFDAPLAPPDVETVEHRPPPAARTPRPDGGARRPHPDRAGLPPPPQ